jgi:hypothetical protein
LAVAGFVEIEDDERRPGWQAVEQAMCEEAAALDPDADAALRSFHEAGRAGTRVRLLVPACDGVGDSGIAAKPS